MTGRPIPTTALGCIERAVVIGETAKLLRNQGDEWYAVCYFYSAYHIVRAALLDDPVFDDLERLKSFSEHLVPDDREATRHNGHVSTSGRAMGINDIVRVLYPQIAVEYRRLHSASIDVRYGHGLTSISEDSIIADYDTVANAYKDLTLKA